MSEQQTNMYEGLQKITGLWVHGESFEGKNILVVKGEVKNEKQRYEIYATDKQKDTSVRIGMIWQGKTRNDKNYYFGYMFDSRAIVLRNKKSNEKQPDWNLFITKKEYNKK